MERVLVRIYLREDLRVGKELAYKKALYTLKELGICGATVLKAIAGYGTTGEEHYEGLEVLSYSLPVVVEFVEEEEKALQAVKVITGFIKKGLITFERAKQWNCS
ncbi:MAG: DUF190 domain-containing protein [Aquificota bacterium]|nr:MAG: DUF190 domain-containing protein [Aquificota bacterium]